MRRTTGNWTVMPRMVSSLFPLLLLDVSTGLSMSKRVLWKGPLFGRLPASGRSFLIANGWEPLGHDPTTTTSQEGDADDDDDDDHELLLLSFVWPSKSGPQFPTHQLHPSIVRPLPVNVTNLLDDKVNLAQLLEGAPGIGPDCITAIDEAKEGELYFVKHRWGAQGKSVYAYNKEQLQSWYQNSKNPHDFVIQKEVVPPALDNEGRKFVLRSHILLVISKESESATRSSASSDEDDSYIASCYLHKSIICSSHASSYDSGQKSAHISQAGCNKRNHPKPVLLKDLEPSHPAANAYESIRASSTALMKLALGRDTVISQSAAQLAPGVTCFALLGNDHLVVSSSSSTTPSQQQSQQEEQEGVVVVVKLCEVNSHPALGWGSMARVPSHVFEELVQDTLSVVALGQSWAATRYQPLELR